MCLDCRKLTRGTKSHPCTGGDPCIRKQGTELHYIQLGAMLALEDTLLPSSGGFMVCQKSRVYMIDMFPFLLKYKDESFLHIRHWGKELHPALQLHSTKKKCSHY